MYILKMVTLGGARQALWQVRITLLTHSEGESLCGEEKMRLGGSVHPQNGDIGGCKASRVATEDYTIDQVRTLGGPDHISG